MSFQKKFFEVGQLHWPYSVHFVILPHFCNSDGFSEISGYSPLKLPNFKKKCFFRKCIVEVISTPKIFMFLQIFVKLGPSRHLQWKIPPTFSKFSYQKNWSVLLPVFRLTSNQNRFFVLKNDKKKLIAFFRFWVSCTCLQMSIDDLPYIFN